MNLTIEAPIWLHLSTVARALIGLILLIVFLSTLAWWQGRRRHRPAWAGFLLTAALAVFIFGVETASPRNALFGPFFSHGKTSSALVALTFDDGPDPTYTPEVLAILDRFQAKATFFMLGERVARYPDLARMVADDGQVIGSHGFHHVSLMTASPQRIRREMNLAENAFEQALGGKPKLFRPPYGFHPPFLLEEARHKGYRVIGWSISPHDSFHLTPEALAQRVISKTRAGDIILLHDGRGDRQSTVAALPLILSGLEAKGLKCVTLPELLAE